MIATAILTLPGSREILIAIALGLVLIAIAVEDLRRFIIPDVLSLPLIPLGLLATWLLAPPETAAAQVLLHAAAMALIGLGFWALRALYRRYRGFEGLGLGDVKLVAAGGAWCGLDGLNTFLLLSCAIAAAYLLAARFIAKHELTAQSPIPFGAALAPGMWLAWMALRWGWLV